MAQKRVRMDRKTICCSICLVPLKDPVTLSCGHSYCRKCIKRQWDGEDQKPDYSCPQCRKFFTLRPDPEKNTTLAELVEQLKKTGLQDSAGPEDAAPFKKHKLVEPSEKLQENICSRHDEVMKMFCRTDRQFICYLCSVDQHIGHEMVSAAAGRSERQKELEVSRLNIQQRIQDRQKDMKLLQQELEVINRSADKAVEDSEKMFTELIRLMEKRSSEVKRQVRSLQETEVSGVKEVEEKLQQEIRELKRKDAELEQLSHTEDHTQFLHSYPSLSALSPSSSIQICPRRRFDHVTAAVSRVRDKLQDVLRDKWTDVSLTEVDVLLPAAEPKTRAEFLQYSCEITLDPNTAEGYLLLSDGNRKVTVTRQPQSYSDHPDRFTNYQQVLSRESLTGRCYWEVEYSGGVVSVAVSYKNIRKVGKSDDCEFGLNNKSWALHCGKNMFELFKKHYYEFRHNDIQTPVSGPRSSRVGVYLDHRGGILSFYSISETMTLLHRVQTTFTQPLHAGVRLHDWNTGDFAEFCDLK